MVSHDTWYVTVSFWVTLLWSIHETTVSHVTVTHYLYCFWQHSHIAATHLKPDQAKPPSPTAMVRQATAPAGVSKNAARSMNTVWLRNAPQVNSFRTCHCITTLDSYWYKFISWPDSNTAIITGQILVGEEVGALKIKHSCQQFILHQLDIVLHQIICIFV